jgi:hypothetical protein
MFETTETLSISSSRKYILWFEQDLAEIKIEDIRKEVSKLGIDFVIVANCAKPHLIELEYVDKSDNAAKGVSNVR